MWCIQDVVVVCVCVCVKGRGVSKCALLIEQLATIERAVALLNLKPRCDVIHKESSNTIRPRTNNLSSRQSRVQ
jgi:hypothetical protein